MAKRQDNFLRLVDLVVLECALVVRNEGRCLQYDKLAERVTARFMVKGWKKVLIRMLKASLRPWHYGMIFLGKK